MKALSLSNPWPWAILHTPDPADRKTIENRSWPPPIAMIGQRIALHAAKSWDDGGISFMLRLGLEPPARFDQYVSSAIVGVATIDRVVTDIVTLAPLVLRWYMGPYYPDGAVCYGWILTDVESLAEPVPASGKQGLWTVPTELEERVVAQLRAVA